ncbi:hypothetical protein FQA47_015457 [Oryzias melastigma]|uniref:Uncharacterized protein n=1 Tax=Oryzias melastigma TaxID=30732 RepID=A0A834L1L5_ORYME|nr:hypothetical protein FQA47_015457 [Oryzias melastigma]
MEFSSDGEDRFSQSTSLHSPSLSPWKQLFKHKTSFQVSAELKTSCQRSLLAPPPVSVIRVLLKQKLTPPLALWVRLLTYVKRSSEPEELQITGSDDGVNLPQSGFDAGPARSGLWRRIKEDGEEPRPAQAEQEPGLENPVQLMMLNDPLSEKRQETELKRTVVFYLPKPSRVLGSLTFDPSSLLRTAHACPGGGAGVARAAPSGNFRITIDSRSATFPQAK